MRSRMAVMQICMAVASEGEVLAGTGRMVLSDNLLPVSLCRKRGADHLMQYVHAPLEETVCHIAKRQRDRQLEHHGEANDIGRRLEIAKGIGSAHARSLQN